MASTSAVSCPEANTYSKSNGYSGGERQAQSVNWEPTPSLHLGDQGYVVVEQLNCSVDYEIPAGVDRVTKKPINRTVSSPRFWGVRLDDKNHPLECRTISQSSLMGRYIALKAGEAEVPTFDVAENQQGFLRAQNLEQFDAVPGSHRPFLKAVKVPNPETGIMEWRGQIVKPVILTPVRRGSAFVVGYEQRESGAESAHVLTNAEGRGIASVNPRFYTFAEVKEPTEAQIKAALKALGEMADHDHFYAVAGE